MLKSNRPVTEEVDRREWDFSELPRNEEHACCLYEYARESKYIVEQLNSPTSRGLEGCLLLYALPPRQPDQKVLHIPWLQNEPGWRAHVCEMLLECLKGFTYAPLVPKDKVCGIHLGVLPRFPLRNWSERHIRLLDPNTGLELMLITIDWNNFTDKKLVAHFKAWIKGDRGRPVGFHSLKGKRQDTWRKKLERLAILRLRRCYSVDEMLSVLPNSWRKMKKFEDEREIRREQKAAEETLLELFPFLPENTKPKHGRPSR